MDSLTLSAKAQGEWLALDAKADVFPKQAFPLGQARVTLDLPGGAGLTLSADPGPADAAGARRAQLQLAVRSLDLGAWLPDALGASVISARVQSAIGLDAQWRGQAIRERKGVVLGKGVLVLVDLGGRRIIKTKKK